MFYQINKLEIQSTEQGQRSAWGVRGGGSPFHSHRSHDCSDGPIAVQWLHARDQTRPMAGRYFILFYFLPFLILFFFFFCYTELSLQNLLLLRCKPGRKLRRGGGGRGRVAGRSSW